MEEGEMNFLQEMEDGLTESPQMENETEYPPEADSSKSLSRSFEVRRVSPPIKVSGRAATGRGSELSHSLQSSQMSYTRSRRQGSQSESDHHGTRPDSKSAAKFESLSKSVLIEIAMSQEAMMKKLQQSLRNEKRSRSAAEGKVENLQGTVIKLEKSLQAIKAESEDKISRLNLDLQRLDLRLLSSESKLEKIEMDAQKQKIKLEETPVEIPPEIDNGEENVPRNPSLMRGVEFVEIEMKEATRVNSDAPTSIESPIIDHLIDCWSLATNRCGVLENRRAQKIEKGSSFFYDSTLSSETDPMGTCVGVPLVESKKLLHQWLESIVATDDSDSGNSCESSEEVGSEDVDKKPIQTGMRVAELSNLPKEIFDGFCIHLIPLLQSFGVKLRAFERPRDVYDLKLTIVSSDGKLPEELKPDPSCIMCRELYFVPRQEAVSNIDEWHSFGSIHTYQYCAHCSRLLQYPVTMRADIYLKCLNGAPMPDMVSLVETSSASQSDTVLAEMVDEERSATEMKKRKKKKKQGRNRVVRIDN
mmetsp:Transcript_20391/g.26450  ORF Transcript_20391/g.26450 Transcript_20391/m.26450 type:complete len:531 (-) Transcript_20391:1017-2609(-)|eukprot:CAMPEP_0184009024 /NCGR_PEP_ID=MMETSP0954-20121128/2347_1 /TAXON_ID=627963 /ORGANISM="Aplanochytrium sp, Strain PBS07" /LENGTH=530 /DNA_ID=CAMNT_0026288295 /DNA_START=136 /DNA_END=1728 /DNA_ORIENTATION=+